MPSHTSVLKSLGTNRADNFSLYINRQAAPKRYPFNRTFFPREIAEQILETAPQVLFPFLSGSEGHVSSAEVFNNEIEIMRQDREHVFCIPIGFPIYQDGEPTGDILPARLEYMFAQRFLAKIAYMAPRNGSGQVTDCHLLAYFIAQAQENAYRLIIEHDEFGHCWVFIRNADEHSNDVLFQQVTVLIQSYGEVIKVIFAEEKDEIDDWYRYEWLSPQLKKRLYAQLRKVEMT